MVKITSPQSLGVALRETRTSMGLPAETLAAIAGVSAVTLRRFETGEVTEAVDTLFTLFRELGIEVNLSLPPGVDLVDIPANVKPSRTRARP